MYIMGGYKPSDTHLFSAMYGGEKTLFLSGGYIFHSIYKDGNEGPNLFQFISKALKQFPGMKLFRVQDGEICDVVTGSWICF